VAVAARVLRLSTTFRRSVERLGITAGSPAHRVLSSTLTSLASAELPSETDHETAFRPGRAFVRRVQRLNLWILYRFDDDHVFVMTARDQPPEPIEP
jgi:hypothetical protein